VALSGRYAAQGAQVRAGLELWAKRARVRLLIEDDQSQPTLALACYQELLGRCELVLGPYGSGSVRAVARAGLQEPLWNHGGAADDVQRLPGVVSVSSPASRYLIALARAMALLRPGCTLAVATARGTFARLAREGLQAQATNLRISLAGTFSLTDPAEQIAAGKPDGVLLCGPHEQEIPLLRALGRTLPSALLGGLSPGLRAFPALFAANPHGLLAPAQWHPAIPGKPALGPTSAELLRDAHTLGLEPLDYVAAQAYACALIAARCREISPQDPLSAAHVLHTTTLFGSFALNPETRIQQGHQLCVIRWRDINQELILTRAA
jgi:Periplasmic binding protein